MVEFNLSSENELRKENILSRITDYDIFQKYLDHKFDLGVVFHSPLRRDVNPSFNIYRSTKGGEGNLLFKDFGIGKHGDCFQFVMIKYSLDFHQCLQMINTDFNLGLISEMHIDLDIPINIVSTQFVKQLVKLPTTILIEEEPFMLEDYEYWASYGIDLKILRLFNVVRCRNSWISKDGEVKRFGGSIKGNPLYAYKDETGYVRKLYRPKTQNRANKWRMSDFDTIDCLWMIKNKFNSDLGILTKSRKDVMVLYSLGYNSCCVEGETNAVDLKTAEMLKREFKDIVVLFDPDKAGYLGSQRLLEDLEFRRTFIQSKYCIINSKNQSTDISDVRKNYGMNKTRSLLNNVLWK